MADSHIDMIISQSIYYINFHFHIQTENDKELCSDLSQGWRGAIAETHAYQDSQSRRSILKSGDGLVQGHLLSKFNPTWFMVWLPCFLSLVQRMSLTAKYSRARANMINREQRLQAWAGVGGGCSVHYSLPSLHEKRSDGVWWGFGGVGGGEEVFSPINSHWGGGEGGGSGRGWCCRDHQSWRIIIAKNKKMVFSSLSN